MRLDQTWLTQIPIAHRGLHSGREIPENSLLSFAKAIEQGHPIELDVQEIADSQEFESAVFHDENTKRLCSMDEKIIDLSASEIKKLKLYETTEYIPTLNEALEFIDGRVPILLEIKSNNQSGVLEKAIYHSLQAYKGQVAVQSFSPWSVCWFKNFYPKVPRGLLGMAPNEYISANWISQRVLGNLLYADYVKADFIGYDKDALHRIWPQFWKKTLMVPLLAWTVRDSKDAQNILSANLADNIIFEGFL